MSYPTYLLVAIVILAILNVVVVFFCFLWWLARKKEREKQPDDTSILLTKDPILSTTSVSMPSSINFTIPRSKNNKQNELDCIDIMKYDTAAKRTLSQIPRLHFEISYDFRKCEVKVFLITGQHLSKSEHKRIMVSVFMTHTNVIYRTALVHGPDPTFNEEFCFHLESIRLSEDPPVCLKFNVRTVNENGEKKAFGSAEMNVEELFTERGKGVNPKKGDGIITRNIIRSTVLSGEKNKPSILISLAYRVESSIINVLVVEARELFFTANDKDIYAIVTLLFRDREMHQMTSNVVAMATNPEFKQDCMFNLYELKIMSIEHISFRIEIQSRYNHKQMGYRSHGSIIIGSSNSSGRLGKDHWATMMTSKRAVTRWHWLEEHAAMALQ